MTRKRRKAPHEARRSVRDLTARKLAEIEGRLAERKTLRDELRLLFNLCAGSKERSPIIEDIEGDAFSPANFVPPGRPGFRRSRCPQS